jgi:hypothetical protein
MRKKTWTTPAERERRRRPLLVQPIDDQVKFHLTPWSRVLPEKLKRPKLLKKFPAFNRTRRFITAFTRARHLFLS